MVRSSSTAILVACLTWLLAAGVVSADDPQPRILLAVTESADLGQRAELVANVVGPDGEPLEGVQVTFLADVEFQNTFSTAVIGEATTDEAGVARFDYVPRISGEVPITARAGDPEDTDAPEVSATLSVQPGPPVFKPQSPIRIPGANVWLIVTVLAATWSVYVWMMWLLQQISADEDRQLRDWEV